MLPPQRGVCLVVYSGGSEQDGGTALIVPRCDLNGKRLEFFRAYKTFIFLCLDNFVYGGMHFLPIELACRFRFFLAPNFFLAVFVFMLPCSVYPWLVPGSGSE